MGGELVPAGEFVLYQSADGTSRVQVRLAEDTVWLTQRQLGELFDRSVPTVNGHIAAVFAEGELDPAATVRSYRIVQVEGSRQVTRRVDHYSLDMVLAVGYRVRSHRAPPAGLTTRTWPTG